MAIVFNNNLYYLLIHLHTTVIAATTKLFTATIPIAIANQKHFIVVITRHHFKFNSYCLLFVQLTTL